MTSNLIVNGRYRIVPVGSDKPKPHTRVTNFAKKLSDNYALEGWGKRMVLLGASRRADIVAAALAADGDTATLDGLVEAAVTAADGDMRRELGTALHKLCEQRDAGITIRMPPALQGDIDAYGQCLTDIGATVERMEEIVVLPDLGLAGRFDRILNIGGTPYIADIKTGRTVDHSWGSIAIQLACYARAETIYHHGTGTHETMPTVDQRRAIVIHLLAGEARADAYWVDLYPGQQGISLTQQVMRWRKTSGIAEPIATTGTVRDYAASRIAAIVDAGHGAHLADVWPEVPTLKASAGHTQAELGAILEVCAFVEAAHAMTFPDESDPRLTSKQQTAKKGST